VSLGHVLVIPRGNWHEIRNVGTVDSQVLHFFAGVGSVDDIGYEAYPGQGDAIGSTGMQGRIQIPTPLSPSIPP
jgi:mannose-6-phosphate isomerase-like protein (cupin superfamily)